MTPEFNFEEYEPLESKDPGYAGLVARILQGNRSNLPYATGLSSDINKAISAATRQRIEGWDPTFAGAMSTLQRTRNDTLKGRLPYEDALAISADRGRLANDLGVGSSGPQIAADLGLKRLDLMTNVGPGLTTSIVNILQGVDPIQRHTTPEGFLLNPQQTLPMAISDNQFGAQFNMTGQLTQAYLDAAPNPAAQGMFNLQAFQAGFGGQQGGGAGQMLGAIGGAFQALGGINWGQLFGGSAASPPIYTAPGMTPGQPGQAYYYGDSGYVPIPRVQPI